MCRRKIWLWILLSSILVLLIGASLLVFQLQHVVLEGTVYRRDLETLSFSSWPIPEQSRLTRFTQLKQIDLLEADISIEQYDELSGLLPDCEILWLVPFQEDRLTLDTENITLTHFTDTDITALQHLPQLKAVTVIDFGSPEQISELQSALPHCRILQQHTIGNTLLDENTLFYQSSNIHDITLALSLFPKISLIDATGCPFYGAIAALKEQYPECRFLYDVPIGGMLWGERSTEIVVDSTTAYELSLALPALQWVPGY